MTKHDDDPYSSLERAINEEAQELARLRKWTVSFALSIIWSIFKSAGELENAQTAFFNAT